MNPFVLDLSRYTDELDFEGSSSGGSTSLLVQILLAAGSTNGVAANNNRTLPYQPSDWTSAITAGGLKVMSYVNVLDSCELVNGIY